MRDDDPVNLASNAGYGKKTKAQRQYESRRAEEERPAREAAKREEALRYHNDAHEDLLVRLVELGIDPEELKSWLEGPRPW